MERRRIRTESQQTPRDRKARTLKAQSSTRFANRSLHETLPEAIFTYVAGRAYHRGAAVVFGDPASLVREPDYPHDGNVIAVINSSGQCIGCVRRDHAEYFAPAMDAGEIRLTGRLGDVDPLNYEEDEAFPPLILRVEFTSTSAART